MILSAIGCDPYLLLATTISPLPLSLVEPIDFLPCRRRPNNLDESACALDSDERRREEIRAQRPRPLSHPFSPIKRHTNPVCSSTLPLSCPLSSLLDWSSSEGQFPRLYSPSTHRTSDRTHARRAALVAHPSPSAYTSAASAHEQAPTQTARESEIDRARQTGASNEARAVPRRADPSQRAPRKRHATPRRTHARTHAHARASLRLAIDNQPSRA